MAQRDQQRRLYWLGGGLLAVAVAGVGAACTSTPVLTQQLEARRLASALLVEFTSATDASNRAVMAETDDGAQAAAIEARRGRQAASRSASALEDVLQSLGYREDLRLLNGFTTGFEESCRLDEEILLLSVEHTNVKAQRLSFGAAQDASDAFRGALDRALRTGGSRDAWHGQALALRAASAVLRIQVLQAPHIAAADLAAMAHLEQEMRAAEAEAQSAVSSSRPCCPRRRPHTFPARGQHSTGSPPSTPNWSRCRAATLTCSHSRCRSGANVPSPQNQRRSFARSTRLSPDMVSTPRDRSAHSSFRARPSASDSQPRAR